MIQIKETHRGLIYLRTTLQVDAITDHTGTTSLIELTDEALEKLAAEANAVLMDRGLRKITESVYEPGV